ncbi:MAG: AraC family transcriptional regulator [Hyphomonadaceae bacterium]|nr:AraC family transcriptional regulator [Hyphomonadaceae bacterium]
MTGCRASASDWADQCHADFDLVAGNRVSIAHSKTFGLGTSRDADCIRDDDDHKVFFLKLDGRTEMTVQEQRFILNPGDGVLVDYADTFRMQAIGTVCDLLVLRLPRTMIAANVGRDSVGFKHEAGSPMLELLRTYAMAAFNAGADGTGLNPVVERHIAELVGTLFLDPRDVSREPDSRAVDRARVVAIKEEIARSYRDPCLTLRRVAARLGFSARLGQLILSRAGVSFNELLFQHRLERAYERLVSPSRRVIDVAYEVGFSDLSHFHRLFKARFGHTPGETFEAVRR